MPYIYHATPVSTRASILREGFRKSSGRCGVGVYFVFTGGQAHRIGIDRFGQGNYDIWRCEVNDDRYDVEEHPGWCGMSAFKEVVVRECGEINRSGRLAHKGGGTFSGIRPADDDGQGGGCAIILCLAIACWFLCCHHAQITAGLTDVAWSSISRGVGILVLYSHCTALGGGMGGNVGSEQLHPSS